MKRVACLAVCSMLATVLVPASVPLDLAQDCVKNHVAAMGLPEGYSITGFEAIAYGDDDVMISVEVCPDSPRSGSCMRGLFAIDANSKTCG